MMKKESLNISWALHAHNERQKKYFEENEKPRMVPRRSPYLLRHVREALSFAQIAPEDRVLEIGCGMGRYTLLLAEQGVKIEGLDLSRALLERLKFHNEKGFEIPLYCADIQQEQPSLKERFDVVLGFFTLHHLQDLEESFRAIAQMLKPGGRVVFLEPNPYNILYYFQILFTPGMSWEGDKGILMMRHKTIFRAMGRVGFQDFSMTRFGFFPPFLANRVWGARWERLFECFPLWKRCLPFQLFGGVKF